MKYIKVTNTAQEVNRLKLEKLGFSTKRDDETSIGQFGSGIKFAPIAAIRKGIDFIFAGADAKGSYTLRYITKDDEGVSSIFYKYDDYEKPSSFTAEAGTLSWENDFQIYREVVANAMDEAKISGTDWDISIVDVDEIIPVDGEFSVYLSATESLLEIHDNFDSYFSVNREPIFEVSKISRIYPSIDGTLRVYCKGVLVYSAQQRVDRNGGELMHSLFDYEFDDLSLNEERTVSSEWDMNGRILYALSNLSDKKMVSDVLDFFIEETHSHDQYYETAQIPAYLFSNGKDVQWKNVFDEKYKDGVIIRKDKSSINLVATARSKGYEPVFVDHDGIEKFLSTAGIKTFENIFGEAFIYDYEMGYSKYPKLKQAIDIVSNIFPMFAKVTDAIGVVHDIDEDGSILGLTTSVRLNDEDSEMTKIILISSEHINSSTINSLIGTLIHEWDHYTSFISDGDMNGRMFRELADDKIGYLVYELWCHRINSENNR